MTTISTILLAALLIVSVCYDNLEEYAEKLDCEHSGLIKMTEDAYKSASRVAELAEAATYDSPDDNYVIGIDGAIFVCRLHNGVSVLVKTFRLTGDADDYEYKMRCAEELLDMLNENPD